MQTDATSHNEVTTLLRVIEGCWLTMLRPFAGVLKVAGHFENCKFRNVMTKINFPEFVRTYRIEISIDIVCRATSVAQGIRFSEFRKLMRTRLKHI